MRTSSTPPTEKDLRELELFAIYLHQLAQAESAGVPAHEAAPILYDDLYRSEPTEGETTR
jgi:hypothetical protein